MLPHRFLTFPLLRALVFRAFNAPLQFALKKLFQIQTHVWVIHVQTISYKIAIWISLGHIGSDEMVAWYRQATSHYLNQWRPIDMICYVTQPQWIAPALRSDHIPSRTVKPVALNALNPGHVFNFMRSPMVRSHKLSWPLSRKSTLKVVLYNASKSLV